MKPNEGSPLNVWRVELANYSARALDCLNAHLNVERSGRPCDHWDGPEGSYGAPVVWTGPLMSIQDAGIVEPGQEVRETAFVLAWHEEEQALGRWDINYDSAASPPAGDRAAEIRSESATTRRVTAAPEHGLTGGCRSRSGRRTPARVRRSSRPAGWSCRTNRAATSGTRTWHATRTSPGPAAVRAAGQAARLLDSAHAGCARGHYGVLLERRVSRLPEHLPSVGGRSAREIKSNVLPKKA